ncbi:hypothetical protein F5890DRAFT_201367 [Lentinula detonsa]|uniref:Uncharacterized protein n=1 Tax=Lentinula detonsa TaxID=2804962 RepID=A0AA38UT92_9AGAR|nr:hypothetical protein F5890DRAFT_201367 [Lentinula detonsa]
MLLPHSNRLLSQSTATGVQSPVSLLLLSPSQPSACSTSLSPISGFPHLKSFGPPTIISRTNLEASLPQLDLCLHQSTADGVCGNPLIATENSPLPLLLLFPGQTSSSPSLSPLPGFLSLQSLSPPTIIDNLLGASTNSRREEHSPPPPLLLFPFQSSVSSCSLSPISEIPTLKSFSPPTIPDVASPITEIEFPDNLLQTVNSKPQEDVYFIHCKDKNRKIKYQMLESKDPVNPLSPSPVPDILSCWQTDGSVSYHECGLPVQELCHGHVQWRINEIFAPKPTRPLRQELKEVEELEQMVERSEISAFLQNADL